MDHRVTIHGVDFRWDSDKADRNVRHHGVTFEEAVEAFFDPFLKIVDATREHEARDALLGMDARWRLLFVVHVEMEEDTFRIISARPATSEEWKFYEE